MVGRWQELGAVHKKDTEIRGRRRRVREPGRGHEGATESWQRRTSERQAATKNLWIGRKKGPSREGSGTSKDRGLQGSLSGRRNDRVWKEA